MQIIKDISNGYKKYQVFEETINFKEAKYLLNEYKKNMTLWKFKIEIENTN